MENPNPQKDESDKSLEQRKSDATSGETVSDLEKNKKDSGSPPGHSPSPSPSPDGMLDEDSEIRDTGPI